MASALQIDSVSVRYDQGADAVRSVSIDIAAGEVACLLGPSGCGKSSLLRAIAGFVRLQTGRIVLGSKTLSQAGLHPIFLAPESRGIGMVFQDYALFPHLTVEENILFGITRGRPSRAEARETSRAREMMDLVGLAMLAGRYPHELSGGQAQRVALARALAPSPGIVLLDEPFSSLDHSLRSRLAREVRDILKSAGTTAILVTHDQSEAFAMADTLGVLFDGRLVQWGRPYDVYHEPCTAEVARFIGDGALISGVKKDHHVTTTLGELPLAACCCDEGAPAHEVRVLLRPDDVVHDDHSPLQARVLRKMFRGADFLYTLELSNGERVLSLVPSHHDHPLNQPIGIRLEADHVVTYSANEAAESFEKEVE